MMFAMASHMLDTRVQRIDLQASYHFDRTEDKFDACCQIACAVHEHDVNSHAITCDLNDVRSVANKMGRAMSYLRHASAMQWWWSLWP